MPAETALLRSVRGVAVLGVVASSGSGKTTLLTALIPRLRQHGLRIGCVKHSHHDFEVDQPGKDSHLLRAAGAAQVMLSGRRRWVLMTEHGDAHDAPLDELVATMDLAALDLVLVEGFRRTALPRIEVHRATHVGAPLCRDDPTIIALASDATPRPVVAVPGFALDDVAAIAAFVVAHVAHVRLQRDDATA